MIRPGLEPFLGVDPGRLRRSHGVALWPYLAGGAMYVVAGLLNPESPQLVLISAAAASFGGTSLLAWYPRVVARKPAPEGLTPLTVQRSTAWIAAAVVIAVAFVLLLGPGISL